MISIQFVRKQTKRNTLIEHEREKVMMIIRSHCLLNLCWDFFNYNIYIDKYTLCFVFFKVNVGGHNCSQK